MEVYTLINFSNHNCFMHTLHLPHNFKNSTNKVKRLKTHFARFAHGFKKGISAAMAIFTFTLPLYGRTARSPHYSTHSPPHIVSSPSNTTSKKYKLNFPHETFKINMDNGPQPNEVWIHNGELMLAAIKKYNMLRTLSDIQAFVSYLNTFRGTYTPVPFRDFDVELDPEAVLWARAGNCFGLSAVLASALVLTNHLAKLLVIEGLQLHLNRAESALVTYSQDYFGHVMVLFELGANNNWYVADPAEYIISKGIATWHEFMKNTLPTFVMAHKKMAAMILASFGTEGKAGDLLSDPLQEEGTDFSDDFCRLHPIPNLPFKDGLWYRIYASPLTNIITSTFSGDPVPKDILDSIDSKMDHFDPTAGFTWDKSWDK